MLPLFSRIVLRQAQALTPVSRAGFVWFCKTSTPVATNKQTVLEAIANRHSLRTFTTQDVEQSKIDQIISHVRLAPSAGNLQSYMVKIVLDKSIKNKLADAAYGQKWIHSANAIMVFCARKDVSSVRYKERGKELYCIQDATIACTYAQLCLQNLGLASCWVGAFYEDKVAEILKLDLKNVKPVAMLPFGYSTEKTARKPRKKTEEIFEILK